MKHFKMYQPKFPLHVMLNQSHTLVFWKTKVTSRPTYYASYTMHDTWKLFQFKTKMMKHMNSPITIPYNHLMFSSQVLVLTCSEPPLPLCHILKYNLKLYIMKLFHWPSSWHMSLSTHIKKLFPVSMGLSKYLF